MKKKLLCYLFIFFLKNNKLSDFANDFINEWAKYNLYFFGGASFFLLAGIGVEYIEREIIVTDRYLRWSKERLNNEEYWKKEADLIKEKKGDLYEIIQRKQKIKNTIERMEKIKAERQKKKEEAEEKKRKQQEENKTFSHNGCCPGGLSHFFFVKNMMKDPNYNQWVCQRMVKSMQQQVSTRHPLSRYDHASLLFNSLQTVSTRYHNLKQIKKDYVQKLSSTMNETPDYPLWSL